ncbi:MAG: glycosyltransferase family 4 protein [Clostridiales bacterium]|nr:glycosyltransferase family 4 protein [Clostridiales bacterium]
MEEKYRVLIVHNYYQIPGGEDTVVANEKKLLEEHGHEVTFYSRSNAELKTMSAARKLLLPLTTVFNPKTYRDVKRLIREKKIDIVHVHNTLNLISPSVYYAAFSCGVLVVQTVHNFRLLCPGATFYRDGHICEDCVEHGLGCALRHSCYRGSRLQTLVCVVSTKVHRILGTYGKIHYICLTEFNREKLLQLKQIRPEQVFVKPNFTYDPDCEHQDDRYYLYIGRIEAKKGVDKIAAAFCKMLGRKLLLAGTGPMLDEMRHRYESYSNISFLGFVPHDELNELLSHTKAVVVNSQCYESFGMMVIEAYAAGVPVLAGNRENISSLVKEGVTGIRFSGDSEEALISAVNKFESSSTAWNDNARKTYEELYSPDSNIEVLEDIYRVFIL